MQVIPFRTSAMAIMVLSVFFAASASTVTIGANKEVLIDGKPFFPIMEWLQNSWRIAGESSYGINTFVGQGDNSSALEYCDSAKAHNVYAVPSWNAAEVNSVKSHSAMLGWVFGDEPDLQGNKVPPSAVHPQYDSIKANDPGHAAFLTITSGFYSGEAIPAWMNGNDSMYYRYPLYTDLIGFDYYPVYGWCRPDWIYKVGCSQDELVNKYTNGQKSTYQWIECAKTSSQWCSIPSRGVDDGPYDYEIRDEVWLAIARGANAIGYFTHSWKCPGSAYSQLCLNDTLVAMLKNVNEQITALTNVLCAADSKASVTVQLTDSKGSVAFKAKDYNGKLYLVAVNVINLAGAKDTQQAKFTVPSINGTVQVYGESRTIVPSGTCFFDLFTKTDAVHIYIIPVAANIYRPFIDYHKKQILLNTNVPGKNVLYNIAGESYSGRMLKPGKVYFCKNGNTVRKVVFVK